jgi:tetratricopeptide (TPR) repeat protein
VISARSRIYLAVLAAAVAVAYANALRAPFIWDDFDLIVNNPLLRSWSNLPEVFRTNPFGYGFDLGRYYRPIQTLSFLVGYQIWGAHPFGFHLVNVLLHLVNVGLAFFLLRRLGFSEGLAFGVALVFAVHPITVECVTFIAVRGDLLLFLFSALAFLALLAGENRRYGYPLAVLFALLALLTKESAVVLAPILALYLVLLQGRKTPRGQKLTVGLIGILTVAYIGIRFGMHLGKVAPKPLSNIAYAAPWQRWLTLPKILVTDVRLLLFPHPVHTEYQFVERSPATPYLWLGLPLLALAVALAMRKVEPRRLGWFLLLWFLVGLAPFTQVAVPLAQTLAERWLYFPSLGFLGLIGLLAAQYFRRVARREIRVGILAFAGLAVVLLAATTISRNRDWQDSIRLFSHDLVYAPDSFLLHHNLGVAQAQAGDLDAAKRSILASIAVTPGPGYGTAHNSLGAVLESQDDLEGALREYRESVRLSRYYLAYANLGRLLLHFGKKEEAIHVLQEGLQYYPQDLDLYYYLGYAYVRESRWDEGESVWKKLQAMSPGYRDVPELLAELAKRPGR